MSGPASEPDRYDLLVRAGHLLAAYHHVGRELGADEVANLAELVQDLLRSYTSLTEYHVFIASYEERARHLKGDGA